MKYEIRSKIYKSVQKRYKIGSKATQRYIKLLEVIGKLAEGETLDATYRDHGLAGNYAGCRECHVEPDWLLIYEYINDVLVLMLYRLGTHSELFK